MRPSSITTPQRMSFQTMVLLNLFLAGFAMMSTANIKMFVKKAEIAILAQRELAKRKPLFGRTWT